MDPADNNTDQAAPPSRAEDVRAYLLFLLAYSLLAVYALGLGGPQRFPPLFWPADGLALGALLVAPRHRRGILVAIVAAVSAISLAMAKAPANAILAGAVINSLEPTLVAIGLLRLGGGVVRISTLYGLGAFLVNAVPMVVVVAFAEAFTAFAFLDAPLREQWSISFVADYLGLILFAPLLLSWGQGGWRSRRRTLRDRALKDRTAELIVLFAGLVLTTHFIFRATQASAGYVPVLAYLCAPFLIWAALRFGLRAATVGLAVFGLLCYWHTANGTGPFAIEGQMQWRTMLHVQGYLATVIVSTLFAAALLAEREAEARSTEAWRRRHEAAIRASGSLLYELDPVSGTLLWDGDTVAVLGRPAESLAHVRDWMRIVHPEDREALNALRSRLVEGGTHEVTAEFRVQHGGGEWITVGVNGYSIEDPAIRGGGRRLIIGFIRDVSARIRAEAERKVLEAQLKQAEKMEAVGRLAGGIAHDFNNILGAILGYGELAQAKAAGDPQLKRYVDTMVNAGNRAKALVAQILAYSRADGGAKTPVEVGPVANEVCDLVRGSGKTAGITVECRVPEGRATVMGDVNRLHQVLMNLASNAVHAMGESGLLEIAVENRVLERVLKTRLGEIPPGEYVAIRVTDTGGGIAPEVMDRIFEPFFTTKPAGRGTGLGLALVHTIVRDHGGSIDVVSQPGHGTTFTVWLPRTHELPEGAEAGGEGAPVEGAGQVVLVVDDEAEVLAALEDMLATMGFEPAGYNDSGEALAAFQADPGRFDAVISDEVMPGLTGTQLTQKLREAKPGIPVVIATGFGGAGFESRAAAAGVNKVLKKPYRMQDIGAALRDVLAAT